MWYNYNNMQFILSILISTGISIGSFFGILNHQPVVSPEVQDYVTEYVQKTVKKVELGTSVLPIGGVTYNLAGAGASPSATSIVLQSFTVPQTGQPILDADLSETFYLTLEPGNRTRQEVVSCTTVVQNSSSVTLSGCLRGLSPISPYTASTSLQFSHAGGSSVIFSDPPQLFNEYVAKKNDETVTGILSVSWPLASTTVASRGYADYLAFNGAGVIDATSIARGIVELATGLEAASSTSVGSAGNLSIPSSISTSTFNTATAPLKVVVTQNNGKIDPYFIATSSLYAIPIVRTYNLADSPATWNKVTGLKYIVVEVWGGGGSGARGTNSASGGGGGGYQSKRILASSLGTTETVTIGAGGAAVTANDTNGNDGSASSFGSHVSVPGGFAGVRAAGTTAVGGSGAGISTGVGVATGVSTSVATPGVYGAAGGGLNASATGIDGGKAHYGGGGGGSAGAGGTAGIGGTSVEGGAGGAASVAGNGTAGSTPGGGGGGAANNTGGSNSGKGGDGRVVVTEYY